MFVTSPSPENLHTLFEFVFKGFDSLEFQVCYSISDTIIPVHNYYICPDHTVRNQKCDVAITLKRILTLLRVLIFASLVLFKNLLARAIKNHERNQNICGICNESASLLFLVTIFIFVMFFFSMSVGTS